MAEQYSYEWVNQQTKELPDSDFVTSLLPDNQSKNRYNNVIANEKTLVPLKSKNYINANYVCGKRYISCQAPLQHTIEDFYNMIWEQNTPIIIMLTNLVEKGKQKATSYFPENTSKKTFGNFVVQVGSVLFTDAQTTKRMETQVRELIVENKAEKSKRSIIHIHYMGWPDFGVPSNMKQISDMIFVTMLFRGKIKKELLNGPPVVHCSAGLGRSGTFIILLRFYEQLFFNMVKSPIAFDFETNIEEVKQLNDKINSINKPLSMNEIKEIISTFVITIRLERKGMVQTDEQYKFIIDKLQQFYKDIYPNVKDKKSKLIDSIDPFLSPTLRTSLKKFMKPLLK